jgi:hypothetical protein
MNDILNYSKLHGMSRQGSNAYNGEFLMGRRRWINHCKRHDLPVMHFQRLKSPWRNPGQHVDTPWLQKHVELVEAVSQSQAPLILSPTTPDFLPIVSLELPQFVARTEAKDLVDCNQGKDLYLIR